MLVCRVTKRLCITWRSRVCCLFVPRELLFSRHLPALYHLYFIYFWFSSSFIHALHGRPPFPRALSSTHFLLHQYFISSSPLFSTCCGCFLSHLSVMFSCRVLTFIATQAHSDLLFHYLFSSLFHVFFPLKQVAQWCLLQVKSGFFFRHIWIMPLLL